MNLRGAIPLWFRTIKAVVLKCIRTRKIHDNFTSHFGISHYIRIVATLPSIDQRKKEWVSFINNSIQPGLISFGKINKKYLIGKVTLTHWVCQDNSNAVFTPYT